MGRPKRIDCKAGEWTTLVSNFGSGYAKTFRVRFESPDGGEVSGEFEERAHWWIFPSEKNNGALAQEMSFHRKWINAIYKIRVRTDSDAVAAIE